MSFFGKLKSKLFKSSAKLEEGLDAIVQEDVAPEEEPSAPAITDAAAQVAQP
ncbi:MAG TPA: signal recognition particle-docking protein FtsY, partial [Planktomarina temperata]|nr:signal recognition particle-docking protein FtsY [Planktomarina temperata]